MFADIRLKRLEGDEAVYHMLDKKGNLDGMISTCVDDFDITGTFSFVDLITKKVSKELDVSKVEDDRFKFTGIDIRKTEDGIKISIEDYAESLEDIEIREDKSDESLTRDEQKILRK